VLVTPLEFFMTSVQLTLSWIYSHFRVVKCLKSCLLIYVCTRCVGKQLTVTCPWEVCLRNYDMRSEETNIMYKYYFICICKSTCHFTYVSFLHKNCIRNSVLFCGWLHFRMLAGSTHSKCLLGTEKYFLKTIHCLLMFVLLL